MSREIVTLQFGNYANYVGTHWWNMQEASFQYDPNSEPSEIDHDIMYREGKTGTNQITYTPRLILVDLKGTLQHMPEEGELYSNNPLNISTADDNDPYHAIRQSIQWETDKVEVIRKEGPIKKPEYQQDLACSSDVEVEKKEEKDYNFKETVNHWIDFGYSRYHPRSINVINEYNHSKDETTFDTFTSGIEMWNNLGFQDEITDGIRQYVEECDSCQGFQTIFDCTDAFSGYSIKCLEHLEDEYSKSIFSVPVIAPDMLNFKNADAAMSKSIKTINLALTYSSLSEHGTLFTPLSTMGRCWRDLDTPRSFPVLNYNQKNLYQSSAILASFLDTITLRYRLKNPAHSSYLAGFCTDMTGYGRKMAAAGITLPLQMNTSEDLIDYLDRFEGNLFTQLTPNAKIGTDRLVQSICARGIPKNRIKRPPTAKSAMKQMKMAAFRCESVSEMFQLYFQCNLYASMTHVTACESPLTTKTPFPIEIFDERVNFNGYLQEFESDVKQKVISAPVLAALQSSTDLSETLESLHREVSRIKIAKIPRFSETGLEIEEYKEFIEKLLDFKEKYDDGFEL